MCKYSVHKTLCLTVNISQTKINNVRIKNNFQLIHSDKNDGVKEKEQGDPAVLRYMKAKYFKLLVR